MADFFSPAVTSLEALFTRFTWRRFLTLLLISAGTAGSLIFFEIYTNSMELSRLQKAATVLNTLRQIDSTQYRSDTSLAAVRTAIGQDLRSALDRRRSARQQLATRLAYIRRSGVAPFLAGGLVWWLLALAGVRRLKQRRAFKTFLLLIAIGALTGLVGILLPFQRLWFTYWLVYPVSNVLILILALYFTESSTAA